MIATLRLTGVHARYTFIETMRVPIAVIGALVFPALAFLFFVVPQRGVADDPVFATQAIIQMMVFALMANALFGFGIGVSQARETPWEPYVRTLPAPGIARLMAQVLSNGGIGLAALTPVLVLGATLTSARADAMGLALGAVAFIATSLPFLFAGFAIGYAMSMKVAIAATQIAMFLLAFGGGLFLPPMLFPEWLDTLSRFLPTRQAREAVIVAVQGGEIPWWAWGGLAAWTVVLLVLTLVLYRRDEGRRYR